MPEDGDDETETRQESAADVNAVFGPVQESRWGGGTRGVNAGIGRSRGELEVRGRLARGESVSGRSDTVPGGGCARSLNGGGRGGGAQKSEQPQRVGMKSSFSKTGIDSAAELLRTACQSGGSPGLWRELVWGRCRHVIVLT